MRRTAEVSTEGTPVNRVSFADVGGLRSAKETLKSLVTLPSDALKQLSSVGVRPLRRILITGPSGTGKSMLVNALASELAIDVLSITGQDLIRR